MTSFTRRPVLKSIAAGVPAVRSLEALILPRSSERRQSSWTLAQRLGSTHVDPNYSFTDRNSLNEGAARLEKLGTRVIKIWFHRCDEKYSKNSTWPNFDSLVERAKHPYFQELFDRTFKTFVLSAYSEPSGNFTNHYFRDGVNDAEYQDEVSQFYELSKYLLETYDGTGKEFILQHWQGDWAIIGSYDPSEEPTEEAVQGMIRWLNARQEGVKRARDEVESDVKVLHAAEVNLVLGAMQDGERRVTNAVLPDTDIDLVSHNSYEEMHRGYVPPNPNNESGRPTVTPREQVKLMQSALDYVNGHTPQPTSYVQEALVEAEKNVFVGEYGFPEVTKGTRGQARQSRLMTEVGLDWGVRWMIYWQFFDNSDEEKGYWLVREDGSKTPTYNYFRNLFESNREPSVTTYVRLDLHFDRLVDNRAFACSELQFDTMETPLDIGTPMAEPVIWNGAFWTHEKEQRTWRWFGGNDGRTTIFVRTSHFNDANRLRLHGYPREAPIKATVSINGQQTDGIEFDESKWQDWWVSLKPGEPTATKSRTKTPTETASLTSNASSTPTPTKTRAATKITSVPDTEPPVQTPGFQALTALAGIGSAVSYLIYQKATHEESDTPDMEN